MGGECIRSENIKFTFLDDDFKISEECLRNQCFIEIIVRKSIIKYILGISEKSYVSKEYFTKREKQVLKYLSLGLNNTEISKEMHISIHTTKMHIHSILSKLSVQGRTQAVVEAIKQNLIQI